mmetsp:Transcript_42936/g.167856  ORF Transcript_42936/g.167856 Transcript_42936/m.167856 type:complete len:103 (-) Transcript_42936:2727-3035(-)
MTLSTMRTGRRHSFRGFARKKAVKRSLRRRVPCVKLSKITNLKTGSPERRQDRVYGCSGHDSLPKKVANIARFSLERKLVGEGSTSASPVAGGVSSLSVVFT